MVERIQPVSPANFLYNMVEIFGNTSKRSQAASEHPLVPNMKAPVSMVGYPQPERGQSISPTRKGPVHIQLERGQSISSTERGHAKSADEGSVSKVAQKNARHVPDTLTPPQPR